MSRHSKWHSIKHKKGVADKKRAKIFTRHGNLIALAARQGGDPSMNPALRLAIENAKKDNFPGGNIDRAIQRGSGEGKEGSRLEEILYEGYGPGGVAIVVQCVTDNRNRTIASLREIFGKNGGNMGSSGSVLWMFERQGGEFMTKMPLTVEDSETLETVENLLEALDDDLDVTDVYTNLNQPEAPEAI